MVRDGIEFFLSQISCQRLIDLVISQLQLKSDIDTKERLVQLAKRIPTLHKLGQIIARNPNIDPALKKWLIQLENGKIQLQAHCRVFCGLESDLRRALAIDAEL